MKVAGIVFIIAGLLAISFPLVAGLTIEVFFGMLVLFAGGAQLADAWRMGGIENRIGHFSLAVIFIVAGLLLLVTPLVGVAAFTLLIAISFIAQGIVQVYYWSRNIAMRNRIWTLVSGLLGLFVGVLILTQWPSSAFWVVGFLVGINLFFLGVNCLTTQVLVGYMKR